MDLKVAISVTPTKYIVGRPQHRVFPYNLYKHSLPRRVPTLNTFFTQWESMFNQLQADQQETEQQQQTANWGGGGGNAVVLTQHPVPIMNKENVSETHYIHCSFHIPVVMNHNSKCLPHASRSVSRCPVYTNENLEIFKLNRSEF